MRARFWLGRAGGAGGEGLAAALAGSGFLAGVPGREDPLVAHDHEAGEPEHERGDTHQAEPAVADGGGGGGP